MIVVIKILSFLLFSFLLLEEKTYFVEQYYSLKRYAKLSFVKFKRNSHYILILMGLIEMCVVFDYLTISGFGCLAIIIAYTLFFVFRKKITIPKTRRSIFLYLISLVLIGISLVLINNYWIIFSIIVFSKIIVFLTICISNIILFPLESLIRGYYIFKAKSKLKRMENVKIIGITGSYGKTSFKQFLITLLKEKYKITRPKGSINTLMGLTRFINEKVDETDDLIVVEIGIDEKNGMKKLKRLLKLDYGVITAIGPMHLATFKTIENVLKAKSKIQMLMKEDATLFINADNDMLFKSSWNKNCEFYHLNDLKFEIKPDLHCELIITDELVKVNLVSEKQLLNLSGAIKLSKHLGLSDREIKRGLSRIEPVDRRQKIYHKDNKIVIDDSYNANLEGALDSIKVLNLTKGKKVVITGGLIEIGTNYDKYNYQLGKSLVKIDKVFLLTQDENHPLKNGYLENCETNCLFIKKDLKEALDSLDEDDRNILISAKGSDFYLR